MAKPKVVCLCGSTRYHKFFDMAMLEETLKGNIVLTVGTHQASDAELFGDLNTEEQTALAQNFADLHRHKISMADEVVVINVDNYIGNHTKNEIAYAQQRNIPVRNWLPEAVA